MKKILLALLGILIIFGIVKVVFAETKTQNYTYPNPGSYTAKVIVTDQYGLSTEKTVPITVRGNTAPTVTLSANPTTGVAPLTVTFTVNATDAENDSMTYTWVYGD